MDGVQLPQGYSHFEEAVYFLPLKKYILPSNLSPDTVTSDFVSSWCKFTNLLVVIFGKGL